MIPKFGRTIDIPPVPGARHPAVKVMYVAVKFCLPARLFTRARAHFNNANPAVFPLYRALSVKRIIRTDHYAPRLTNPSPTPSAWPRRLREGKVRALLTRAGEISRKRNRPRKRHRYLSTVGGGEARLLGE